ncbi:DNA-binding CsgD family transcriptional regulator [Streptacidiphilus sp. MAP12-16]|uniref:ATP-binding protein n=1 Tax=Streptacidiphilus sp. MAP12-16 TaxID=3156300 RepID=UPI003510DC7F
MDETVNAHSLRAQEVLLGRERELRDIGSFLDRAVEEGHSLLLTADAGMGKTALLDAAVREAAGRGMRVLRLAGLEFEADLGFSGLNQLLLPLREVLPELDQEYQQALQVALGLREGPSVNRLLIFNAVRELLTRSAGPGRLLLVVDDVQWLDEPSTAALGFLIRRLTTGHVSVLAAARTGHEEVIDRLGAPVITVRPLSEEACGQFLRRHFPDLAEAVYARLTEEAHGNPLALRELPTALTGPQRAALAALPPVLPLTRRLLALYSSRIGPLSPRTRELLLLAVLDGTGEPGILDPDHSTTLLQDLAPAEAAGLLRTDPHTLQLTFPHPLVTAAIVEMASSEERRRAHQRLAQARAAFPDQHAWHLAQATLGPDEDIAVLLEASAHRLLRRGDAVGAVTALSRAADLSPEPAGRARRLVEAAYLGADVTGQLHQTSRMLQEARRIDPGVDRSWQAAVATAHVLFYRDGDITTAHHLLTDALDTLPDPLRADDELLLGALHTLLMLCWTGGRPELWPPFHRTLARLRPEPPAVLTACSYTVSDPVRTPDAVLAHLEALIRHLPREQESTRVIRVGLAAINLHRTAYCREAYQQVQRDARAGGAITSGIKSMAIMSTEDVWTGRWADAEQQAKDALAFCDSHGYNFLAHTARYTLALLAAAQGRHREAIDLAEGLSAWAVPRDARAITRHALHVRLQVAVNEGDFEQAWEHATAICPPGELPSHVPHAVLVTVDLVEAAMRTGRQHLATAHVRALHQANLARLSPRTDLFVRTAAALADPDDGDRLFTAAISVPGAEHWPLDLARTRLLYGEWLRRNRATTRARTQLTEALDVFRALGAQPWAARAEAELRAAGRPSIARPDGDPLTARERDVADLAAQGLSNRQIGERLNLSPRTVGYYLGLVYPKLGVTSRAALRDALQDTDPGSDPTGDKV